MGKKILITGCISAALAVIIGAFGAHGLENKISEAHAGVYETGVTYHFYHSFALLICGLLALWQQQRAFRMAAIAFVVGIVLFSGSLYLLSCRELLGIAHWKWLGPLTPLGGLCFILGWGGLARGAWRLGSDR